MIATMNAEFSGYIWIGSFLDILDMGPVYSYWDIVFRLTSYSAGMASYALTIINNEAEINHVITSLGYAQYFVGLPFTQ